MYSALKLQRLDVLTKIIIIFQIMTTISEEEVLLRLMKDGTFESELSDDKEVMIWLKNLGQLAKLDVSELKMAIENAPAMRDKVDDFFESVQTDFFVLSRPSEGSNKSCLC
jgi:hypothetical protein